MSEKIDPWDSIIVSHCAKLVDDYIYVPAANYNALYRFREDGSEVTYLGSFLNERLTQKHLYGAIAENNGILYLPPMNGLHIASYEIATGRFGCIELDERCSSYDINSKFFGAVSWKQYIFFIPCRYRALVRLDTETGELLYIDEFINKYWSTIPKSEMLIKNGYFIDSNKLYLAGYSTNQIISIDLCTSEENLIEIILEDGEKEGFMAACVDGDNLYLVRTYASQIVRYSRKDKSVKIYETSAKAEQWPFINIVKMKQDCLFAQAYRADKSIYLNADIGLIQNIWNQQNITFEDCWNAECYFIEELDAERYIRCGIRTGLFSIIHRERQKNNDFTVMDQAINKRKLSNQTHLFMRENNTGLKEYFEMLLMRNMKMTEKEESKETIGSRIHRQIMEEKV